MKVIGSIEVCRAMQGQGITRRKVLEKLSVITGTAVAATVATGKPDVARMVQNELEEICRTGSMERFITLHEGAMDVLRSLTCNG